MGGNFSGVIAPNVGRDIALIPTQGLEGLCETDCPGIADQGSDIVYCFPDYPPSEWQDFVLPKLEKAAQKFWFGWPFYTAGEDAMRTALRLCTKHSSGFQYSLYDTQSDGKADNNSHRSIFIKVIPSHPMHRIFLSTALTFSQTFVSPHVLCPCITPFA